MSVPGIKDEDKYKKFLSLIANPLFYLKIGEFRKRFNIPILGFPAPNEDYRNWVIQQGNGNSTLEKEFTEILSRCISMGGVNDSVFKIILAQYILFNKFPIKYPTELHLPSVVTHIESSKILGYADIIFSCPIFFSFEDLGEALSSSEGLIKGFIENVQESAKMATRGFTYHPLPQEIKDSFLQVTPGNPAEIVFTTEKNIDYLIVFGRNLLRESVKALKSTKIEKYEDKNKHISDAIQQMGTYLSSRQMFNVSELYWQNITDETDIINEEYGLNLNRGISLGNTGVYQLAQGKIEEGLFNLYRAFEEDRAILELLQHPEVDPGKNLVSAILYTQFEKLTIDWLWSEVLLPHSLFAHTSISRENFEKLIADLQVEKRLQFFDILCSMKLALTQEQILANPLSRGKVLSAFSDLGIWIEDQIRRIDTSASGVYNVLQNYLKFKQFPTMSNTLDTLQKNIRTIKDSNGTKEQVNAQVTILIRNFSEHNFDSQNHEFFSSSKEYLSRIIYTIFSLWQNKKI